MIALKRWNLLCYCDFKKKSEMLKWGINKSCTALNVPYINQPVVQSQLFVYPGAVAVITVRVAAESSTLKEHPSLHWNCTVLCEVSFLHMALKMYLSLKPYLKSKLSCSETYHVLWLPDYTASNKKKPLILLSSVMRTKNLVFKVHTVLFWVLYMLVCLQWRSSF
jgi:hypothetical protein